MTLGRAVTAVVLVAGTAAVASAQQWQTVDVARQLLDTGAVTVKVTYAAGKLTVRGAAAPYLYSMQMRYDGQRGQALSSYDAGTRSLRVGMSGKSSGWSGHGTDDAGDMQLALTRRAVMDLTMDLGATDSDLDLSAMALRTLEVRTGASETTIRFDSVSRRPIERMQLNLGAAAVHARHLANAGVQKLDVRGGVGEVDLDLTGAWSHDMDVQLDVALGAVTIVVPRDVGVRIEADKVFGTFDFGGLKKSGGAWVSDGFDAAAYKVRIRSSTVMGKLTVERR
jgi:hypothetical protein